MYRRWCCRGREASAGDGLDGLVDGLAAAEAEAVVQAHGRVVLGRHLQEGPPQPGPAEAVQRLQEQRRPEAAAPVAPGDADILDRPQSGALPQPLDRAAVALLAGQQPGGLRQETLLAADLAHQAR